MKIKISELPEADAKQYIYDAYMAAVDAHQAGELKTEGGLHPCKRIFAWHNLGRERDAAARDADMDNPDLNVADADNPEGSPDPKPTTNTGVPRAEPRLSADSTPISPLEATLLAGMARDERRSANWAALGIHGYDRIGK
jgi:hypothetical protein